MGVFYMTYDCVIKNGIIVTENDIFKGDICISKGKIAEITSDRIDNAADNVIEACGKYILAGAIDLHVHFNDPGRTHWEDWEHGTKAAASGGITTVADMPINSLPALINTAAFDEKIKAAGEKANIDYMFWGGLVNDNLADIPELHDRGIIAFKAFMSNSGVEFTTADDAILLEGLKFTKEKSCFIGVHAENDAITTYYADKLKASGRTDRAAWTESRPEIQELEAISRFLLLLKYSQGNGHICHVSVSKGFDIIEEAKKEGIQVTGETCAHYLWFNQDDFAAKGPLLKCAPPLRSDKNRNDLWKQVMNGKVDFITSDHSPCSESEKVKGNDNIWKAWGGVSGIQNTIPVMITEGVHKRNMPLTLLTKIVSANPAKRAGIYGKKGLIAVGADADLMIIDLDEEWTFSESDINTKNKISPYIGEKFTGKVEKTMVRGKLVFDNTNLTCNGYGKYVGI
jgi:allantoinase